MFLTHKTIKTLKSVLLEIPDPDAPGSSRLGEALAAGFGFPDYHAMKQELDRLETDLNAPLLNVGLDHMKMVARLGQFGVRSQHGWDLAATALHVFHGDEVLYISPERDDEPPLRSARYDLSTDAWRSSILSACHAMAFIPGPHSWHMRIADELSYEDGTVVFPEDQWELLSTWAGQREPSPLTAEDFEAIDQIDRQLRIDPRAILQRGILMAWDIMPGPEVSKLITLYPGGLKISCMSDPDCYRLDILLADSLLKPNP